MPLYLTKFSYTPETWSRLIGNPEDRRKAAQSYIEAVGGKLHGFWYAFGTHDGYNLWEAPDNVSMAAVALAISGGGALVPLQTPVLFSGGRTAGVPPGRRRGRGPEAPAHNGSHPAGLCGGHDPRPASSQGSLARNGLGSGS